MTLHHSRRAWLQAAASLALTSPLATRAQNTGPIRVGALVPLTGGGAAVGPEILAGQKLVVDEVNAAGGVLGRQVELVVADSQTNPEAAVRAARKLIDVDRVVAISGPWASSVASAVAPLCWEGRTPLLLAGAAADSITQLPHQGFILRTQPNMTVQSQQFGNFAIAEGARHLYILIPQTPFTEATIAAVTAIVKAKGIAVSSTVYDPRKTSFRSEVDAVLKSGADLLFAGGYLPDNVLVARDLYRANYRGKLVSFSYAVTPQFIQGAGAQAAEGFHSLEAVPDAQATAYARLNRLLKRDNADIFTAHGYDHLNLVLLAIAQARAVDGVAVRDAIRLVGSEQGEKIDNAVEGIRLLGQGKRVNYLGASGPCKFAANGDVITSRFRVNVVRGGKIETLRHT